MRTFSFGEKDPEKIDEILKSGYSDDDEDIEDGIDEEDEDNDEPEESYRTTVSLNPQAVKQYPFGENKTSVYQPGVTPPNPIPVQAQRNMMGTVGGGTSSFASPGYQPNPLYRPAQPAYTPFTPNTLSGGSAWNTGTTSPRYNPGGWGSTPFGNTGGFPGNAHGGYNPNPGYQTTGERRMLPRHCRIIFCELDDVLIQPVVSEACPTGKLGMGRRGIYDIQDKWPVWEAIRCINPEFVFIVTNQDISTDEESLKHYQELTDSLIARLSKFLYIPQDRCKCFTKLGRERNEFSKPNTGLMTKALFSVPGLAQSARREDMVMIGAQSGGPGQSDVDYRMAVNFGIDYIPVDQILLYQ